MLNSILESIFGCAHRTTTFPLTPRGNRRNTYVVCLDCGKEFGYDWNAMRIADPVAAPHATMIPAIK
jgi:hypothetical protein